MDEESMMNASLGGGEGEAGPSTLPQTTERPEGMSKNAMKRAAKQARMEELKPLKRAAEKQRRKERSNELALGYKNGTLSEQDLEIYERRKRLEKERKVAKRQQQQMESGHINNNEDDEKVWKGGIVIDLGFDDLMNEQEISSMASQISYCYSINRIAPKPIKSIIHTSFSPTTSPRLWNKMIDRNWNKWSRSFWWDQSVGEFNKILNGTTSTELQPIISASSPDEDIIQPDDNESTVGDDLTNFLTGPKLPSGIEVRKHTLVYLSADAEDELTTLDENEIYVIGGIVDRNRYKNLCQNKAEILNIKTARLPIGKFIENLPTRKVLTVNQVFDILIQFIAQNDWQKAFETVIPQRKFHESKKAKHIHNNNNQDNDDTKETIESGSSSKDDEDLQKDTDQNLDAIVVDEEESVMNQQ